ncbi:surfeit locus 1 family protein [Trypanosoma rangeli]|uniref:SURF1-like protein n=1 Tax=Trypanosoma rangeli TaxID=5698 RepID=A0A3R7MI38_TRYRA|nr:surfeit locus 1 family protein [Trypanosoma rangeli]RNF02906.1 surfeit locus 1 family protein [Trypanosoma rangeli]|eukprot:RNF02906.1 surfeit locus 1 family protein [Trypanosoma rangeli]
MRPDYMGVMFLTSAVVSFNAGIWQIFRRAKKKQLIESHKNLLKPAVQELPPNDMAVEQFEFLPVKLDGVLDNEGSVLVGPRALPSYKGTVSNDESKGGFLVVTPFEIAGTKQFVMVNRGWVPIDAGKHRTLLMQYIGEGFATATVRGIFRREEFLSGSFFSGKNALNEGPLAADLSWMALRPLNMALDYYKRRWGASNVEASVSQHGLHHYYVEMLEDYSGDDQRIVRGHAWPWRRSTDEVTYVHLLPVVHTMYVFFWFSVTIGSLYGMGRCYQRQKELFAIRRRMTAQSMLLEKKRQEEAQAYLQAVQEVERMKHVGAAVATAQLGAQQPGSKETGTKP